MVQHENSPNVNNPFVLETSLTDTAIVQITSKESVQKKLGKEKMDFSRNCYTKRNPLNFHCNQNNTKKVSSNESDLQPLTFKSKLPSLALKKKTESSEIQSSGNYSIESPSSSTQDEPESLKRPAIKCSPAIYRKKVKLDEKSPDKNDSIVENLQDTLDNINITTIFGNASKKSPSDNLNKSEFDAFADFFNHGTLSSKKQQKNSSKVLIDKDDTTKNMLRKDSENPDLNEDDLFSQSFNTQMINQINVAIPTEETQSDNMQEIDNKPHKSSSASKLNTTDDDHFKVPLLKSFSDKILSIKAKKDQIIQDRTLLFNDSSVTSQYKKDVDSLFEQIEQSICAMGTEDNPNPISEKILDVIFADDASSLNNNKKLPKDINKSLADIQWEDESFLAGANCSFGTVFKQALLENANKKVQQQSENFSLNNSLNRSLSDGASQFRKLGNFYDLPDKVKDLIKQYKGFDNVYDWQDECLNLAITNRKNLIYALPTSGGKTLVAEILMLREVLCYQRNAIFILPYVAIVQEKVWDLSPFGIALDFLVEEFASSKGSYPPRKRRRKHTVYIATIEKASGLVNSLIEAGRLHEIGLIVIDELHLIGEEGRGATLEACLTKILFLKANIQIVGMSATIGNIQEVCKFLNAEIYTKDFRPVELTEYVKCSNEIARINWKYADENDLLVDPKKLDFKYSEAVNKLDPDMLGGLALEVVPKGSCLVFCPSKKNCENVVYLLCKLAKPNLKNYKKTEKQQLLEALKGEAGDLCDILKVSVPYGIAYHHSGLTNDERKSLEDAFRVGTISVICCTSTLAAGVNLPARRVILRSPYIGKDFINLSRYKQMSGRAGRTGLGEMGESIIITQPSDLHKVKQLLMSPMNQALSSLHQGEGRGLRHLMLSCISLGIANTRLQLQKVARETLMAVQVDKLKVDVKRLADNVIKNLFKLGALQENCAKQKDSSSSTAYDVSVRMDTSLACLTNTEIDSVLNDASSASSKKPKKTVVLTSNTKLVVSNLGIAAIKGGLELSRAHQLYDDLYQAQKSLVLLNSLHLLYLVTPYDTSEQIRPNIQVYYEVLMHLGEKELQTAKVLGFDEAVTLKMATGQASKQIPEKILNRFYVTLMLFDLWNETPVFKVSEKFQINRGIVQNLMTISATFASNVVNFCQQLEEFWAFAHLLKGMTQRLSHCCNRELLPLMELPSVKQSRATQLYKAGYKNLQSIAKANVNDLIENIEYMNRRTACQLIAASKMLLLEKVENLREEAEDVLDGVENPKQLLNVSIIPVI